jgi:sulfite oxidase
VIYQLLEELLMAIQEISTKILPRPGKHAEFVIRQSEPLNGGGPPELLVQNPVTPTSLFFVRSHGNVPRIDLETYRLHTGGMVEQPLEFSLTDLRERFPICHVTAALQCAGNRRNELSKYKDISGELPWDHDAIGNAVWTGVSLLRVLELVEIQSGVTHIAFSGLDDVEREGSTFKFGGSIPFVKAICPDVLLAYEMNGEPLAPLHGAPLRLVVPGYIGARSVKWLSTIILQDRPSDNFFQQKTYRLFPPEVTRENAMLEAGKMLEEYAVSAAICQPAEGDLIESGPVRVSGYAIGRGGSAVEHVEVSIDGGLTWIAAELQMPGRPWAWQIWHIIVDLPAGPQAILAQAFDVAGNAQPADIETVWNFKGYLNNAWHSVNVQVNQ